MANCEPDVSVSDIRFFILATLIVFNTNMLARIRTALITIAALVWAALFFDGPLMAKGQDVHVLQSDVRGVTIEYIPSYGLPISTTVAGRPFLRFDFEGSVPIIASPLPGSPEVLARTEVVQCLSLDGNTVEVIQADYEDLPNVMLAPAPDWRDGEVSPERIDVVDENAYRFNGFRPSEVVALENIGETRGRVLGNLVFHPLQYNPAQRLLRKHSRIVVRVNFNPSASPRQTASDPLVDKLAVNTIPGTAITTGGASLRKQSTVVNSAMSSGSWYKLTIDEDGIYKLTGQALLAAGIPASTDPRTIRVYGNGGIGSPLSSTAPYVTDPVQNAVYVSDGGTPGQLDAGDFIIFYAKSARGWNYDPATKTFRHYINSFSAANVYWIAIGLGPSKPMTQIESLQDPSPFRPATVTGKLFREDEKFNMLSSGLEWLGQSFGTGDQVTYVHPLPGLDVTSSIMYRMRVGARSPSSSNFTVSEHGAALGSPIQLFSTNIGNYFDSQFKDAVVSYSVVPSFSDAQSQLRFSYSSSNASGTGYLDWYEIFYSRRLVAQGEDFNFHTQDTTATAEYAVTGFSEQSILAFDVSRFDSVLLVQPRRISADSCIVQLPLQSGTVRELYLVGSAGYKTPGVLSAVSNQNVHGSPEADYIIVVHPDFLAAAQRLKSYRESSPTNPISTLLVTTNQVYNEFGGGLSTPIAIRNFLRYASENWASPPKYVLLFGDGDYDYRRISTTGTNWMPAWETQESFVGIDTYASDDNFALFGPSSRVALGVGRLTCRSLAEANTMVDKIIEYERTQNPDPWKLRITFVADDGPAAPGENNGYLHVQHAETVAGQIPPMYEKRKIYLPEYATVSGAGGRRKPTVNEAIVRAINQGTFIVNFSGHGNPRIWTHEGVFVRENDFPLLRNKGKYFLLIAATCNFSMFDVTTEQSGGEVLLAMKDAGAIGVLSATRAVFAGENLVLNKTYVENMFRLDGFGRVIPQRLGDAIYRTKQTLFGNNDRKYVLLGDPALVVGIPYFLAGVDSINGQPNSSVAQLQALARASVSASVRDPVTGLPTNFSGNARVIVFDAERSIEIDDPSTSPFRFPYRTSGSVLFRGDQTITNGTVRAQFVVPRDISYNNDTGRVVIYFYNAAADGAGYTTKVRVGGTDTTAGPDTQGPTIALYLDRRDFRPGDVVSASPTLIADLSDSSGINTSDVGIGHRIEAWLDGQAEGIDLSASYRSKPDTYKEGVIEYQMPTVAEGLHRLRLRAWDTYNNPSTTETLFDVGTSTGLRLTKVFNFPNPFHQSTVFTFEHNQLGSVDAEVKIYTVAGRLVQSLKKLNVLDTFVQIPWDGRDRDGDEIANGVYLYKVIVRTIDGRFASESLGKLSVAR
jgi:hypothetical protein